MSLAFRPALTPRRLLCYCVTTAASVLTTTTAMTTSSPTKRHITVTTWNIAAINNNPFEYWITMEKNPAYEKLMIDIESFIDSPGEKDLPVHEIFTDRMFDRLETRMKMVGWDSVRTYWESDFRNRRIISGFLKDKMLGNKRLASMPDRITNTINIEGSDGYAAIACRPTVINMYEGDLSSLDLWYEEWEKFMFTTELKIKTTSGVKVNTPYKMLTDIKNSKYPAITEDEEKVSIPLQTMCGAIFDAILVHMMNTLSTPSVWQPMKKIMIESLQKKKVPNTLKILENTYASSDIIALQEVSSAFINMASEGALGVTHHVIYPEKIDSARDQNSVLLLKKSTFPNGSSSEITSLVESAFEEGAKVPVSQGDILAITADDADGVPYVIASFHGDTNGLATIPVLDALMKVVRSDNENSLSLSGHKLIFGLDANTYESGKSGKMQDVLEFGKKYVSHDLTSCWGDVPNPKQYTTYNARTFLQPQLNKACKSTQKKLNGDVNPKDFILFNSKDFGLEEVWKDNTGEKKYIEDMAFPTLNFPSDHGLLSAVLKPNISDGSSEL